MDRVRVGLIFRAVRRDQRLRQADVAARADVAQQTISDIERGRFGRLSVDVYCRVAEAVGAEIVLAPRWRGPKLARLLDRRHARLQDATARLLSDLGWKVRTEETFNDYGDRGSVDILAWLASTEALLIVEIKSEIDSLEGTLRALKTKIRVVPRLVRRELGWQSRCVGAVLVLPDGSTHRDLVARHDALVSACLPARTCAVRQWVATPVGDIRGVWFLRDTDRGGLTEKPSTPDRIRLPKRSAVTPHSGRTRP